MITKASADHQAMLINQLWHRQQQKEVSSVPLCLRVSVVDLSPDREQLLKLWHFGNLYVIMPDIKCKVQHVKYTRMQSGSDTNKVIRIMQNYG